jgi:hypothetical protein
MPPAVLNQPDNRRLPGPSSPTWEERSVYRGDQWMISRIKCLPGDYVPKERV